LKAHWDSNSQGGSSLGNVRVHSLTLPFIPRLVLLAHNLATPCFSGEPKARVTTQWVILELYNELLLKICSSLVTLLMGIRIVLTSNVCIVKGNGQINYNFLTIGLKVPIWSH
jgi:hypothetical protein